MSSNDINTDAELLAWLMQRNSELEQRSDEEWLEMLKGNEKGKVKRCTFVRIALCGMYASFSGKSSLLCFLISASTLLSRVHWPSSHRSLRTCPFTRTVFVPFTFFRFHSFPQKHRGLRSRSAAKGLSTSASIPSGSASTRTTTTAKATTTESISKGISMPQIYMSRFIACTSMRVPHDGQLHTSNSRERSPSCAPVSA